MKQYLNVITAYLIMFTLIILVGLVVGAIIIVTYLPIFQFGAALG